MEGIYKLYILNKPTFTVDYHEEIDYKINEKYYIHNKGDEVTIDSIIIPTNLNIDKYTFEICNNDKIIWKIPFKLLYDTSQVKRFKNDEYIININGKIFGKQFIIPLVALCFSPLQIKISGPFVHNTYKVLYKYLYYDYDIRKPLHLNLMFCQYIYTIHMNSKVII